MQPPYSGEPPPPSSDPQGQYPTVGYPPPYPSPYPPPYPPPGWQPPYVHPADRGRNGFAVAGLVLGIVPITAGLLGIIFGLIGRSQAQQRGQKGKVMGTWGAALGAAWLVLIVIGVAVGSPDEAKRDAGGQVTAPGDASSLELKVGDCLRTLPKDTQELTDVDLGVCSAVHKGEVYANITAPFTTYPGDSTMSDTAERECTSRFEAFIGKKYDDSTLDVFYLYPTQRSWRFGDRTITCIVAGDRLVGTAKGSRR